MKKILSYLPLLALSVLSFYACNTSGSGESYSIKLRLNKGDTFVQNMQMNMLMNTSGIEMNMTMNTGNSFEVINSGPDEKELKITYTKMQMAVDMGKAKKLNISDSLLNNSYKNIVGKSVLIKLSKNNEIISVSGFDEIMNNQLVDSASKDMMKKMFSKEQLNSMFGMMFSIYPKNPVKVGEGWTSDSKVMMANIDMKIANKYTLLSVKNGLAEISIDGAISSSGDVLKESSGIKMDMTGSQKGTITLKIDNGYLHSGFYIMNMKAEMQMMGQKLPMTMKADYTIKGN